MQSHINRAGEGGTGVVGNRSSAPIRLGWLATHPIQYQAPLFRAISRCPDIDLTVLFFSDFSTRDFVDRDFAREIHWDTPLLEGYRHEFLPGSDAEVRRISSFRPLIGGLGARMKKERFDAVVVQGWQHYGMIEAAWRARRNGLKVLMRCEATDHVRSSTGVKRVIREAVVRFILEKVDSCLAIGSRNRNFYRARGIPEERIGFMPYAVDNGFFRSKAEAADVRKLRLELGIAEGRPVIVFSGKLMRRKNPNLLLDAYRTLSEPRPFLLFVGDGEMRASLQAEARRLGLSGVKFAGFRNQSEMPAFYALCDIFVLPSVDETWGLVVNEAMNAGCAVILTEGVGCGADLVRGGENGYVVPSGSAPALADAIGKCLEGERFRLMGGRSREIISSWGIEESVSGLCLSLGLNEGSRTRGL